MGAKPIPGKWYVIDTFDDEADKFANAFDTYEQAEAERRGLNVDGDCVVAQFRITDPVRKVGRLFPSLVGG